MLKKLFAAALLLAFTATAHATPMGINGTFDMFGTASIATDAAGEITSIDFDNLLTTAPNNDDYLPFFNFLDVALTPTNPLFLNDILNKVVFEVAGFTFTSTSIRGSSFTDVGGLISANLYLIGDVSGNGFATTSSQFHFSTQGLIKDGLTLNKGFSVTVTSPAPAVVSEPGTLAIFALSLIGFAASRKKKSA
jgi:hypothetical protein